MRTCPNCNEQVGEDTAFCKSCGTPLKAKEEINRRTSNKPVKKRKNFTLIVLVAAVLLIGLVTGYQLLSKKYSEQAVEAQFKAALLDQDKASLRELIQPDDRRLKINDESLDALFALIDSEQSIVHDMINNLQYKNEGEFSLREDGKHFGIFNRYVIEPQSYYISLTNDTNVKTAFYINAQKEATLAEDEEFTEIGPFLAGSYDVKAVSADDKDAEDTTRVKVHGSKSKVEVALDTGEPQDKTDTAQASGNVNTVSGYQINPNVYTDGYILPHSSYSYLQASDLYGLSSAELRVARNEIFARHGYIFKTAKLQNYFNSMDWYSPNPGYDGSLSSLEKSNVDLIKAYE